jgi:hypothetical protein
MRRRFLIPLALMLCVVGLAAVLLTVASREDGAARTFASLPSPDLGRSLQPMSHI